VWYGCFDDITSHVKYEETIEQIAFDISHVMRKPVANLIGLSNLIEMEDNISEKDLKSYAKSIKEVSNEMDRFTRELDETYQSKAVLNQANFLHKTGNAKS
jgi:light-regulated signal transduction histidine kinase (bacteriophytochrome)